ncbi:MAG TPA: gamma-glutamyltransferase [Gemmatimonadaceae bacterium]|nr:gamma-glutamyltransferase [Gemmatimonadaceae bacterium]
MRARRSGLPWRRAALAAAAFSGCSPQPHSQAAVGHNLFEPEWEIRARARPFTAGRAAVSSNSHLASLAGVEMLRLGGNAVDAAVATGFALSVTHPEAGSLGGGGFMVIRMGTATDSGEAAAVMRFATTTLDFRETAPAAATRDMYSPERNDRLSSTVGYGAISVPGLVAGLTSALERHGSLPLRTVLAPAIRLAEDGFIVDSLLARSIAQYRSRLERFAGRTLLIPDGRPLAEGDTLRQPALARTLKRLAAGGAAAFYRGEIAAEIAADVRHGGGLLDAGDLASYRAIWREPVAVRYRGYTMVGAPLPSSGLLTAGQALMILEALGPPAPFGSARSLHATASALQRAFIDRARLGDPGTTAASAVAAMQDRERAAALAGTISFERATPTGELTRQASREGLETTHWSVVDASGNAVAATTTINDIFGSGVFVAASGIFLSDTMDDFAAQPGRTDQWGLVSGEANSIAGGKRPLSTMTPFLLLDRQQRLVLIAGSRGGPRIISNVLQLVTNVVDHRMSVTDAISAPRVHHQGSPDEFRYEIGGFSTAVVDSLRAMGHTLAPYRPDVLPYMGRAVAIGRTARGWEAVVDPRFGELSAGY